MRLAVASGGPRRTSRVKALFTAPTAFRAIKKEDPNGTLVGQYDLPGFRYLFLAGDRLDPETYRWAGELLGIRVIDHWWQTETGWPIAADLMGLEPLPTKAGSPTVPVPGYDVRILGADGTEAKPAETGEIAVRLPLPPGCLPSAVIGVNDQLKGQIPRGFVVLKAGVSAEPGVLSAELVQLIRDRIGPVAAFRRVDVVSALPKTRSGKILRKTMRSIADGQDEADRAGRVRTQCH